MDSGSTLGTALKPADIVLFSGGQDSTTVLVWALSRYERVETLGFRYGQKHSVEMERRPIIRDLLRDFSKDWEERLGIDHVVNLDLIGEIATKIPPFEGATT